MNNKDIHRLIKALRKEFQIPSPVEAEQQVEDRVNKLKSLRKEPENENNPPTNT